MFLGGMRLSLGFVPFLVVVVGCSKAPPPTSGTGSSSATATVASNAKPASARPGPCATDADCRVLLEPCSCSCLPAAGGPLTNEEWAAMCAGGHPTNCGAVSACMGLKATCETTTKTCRVAR